MQRPVPPWLRYVGAAVVLVLVVGVVWESAVAGAPAIIQSLAEAARTLEGVDAGWTPSAITNFVVVIALMVLWLGADLLTFVAKYAIQALVQFMTEGKAKAPPVGATEPLARWGFVVVLALLASQVAVRAL